MNRGLCGLYMTPLDMAWLELCERAINTLTPNQHSRWKCIVRGIGNLEKRLEAGQAAFESIRQGGGDCVGSVLSPALLAKLSVGDRKWFEEAMEEVTL